MWNQGKRVKLYLKSVFRKKTGSGTYMITEAIVE